MDEEHVRRLLTWAGAVTLVAALILAVDLHTKRDILKGLGDARRELEDRGRPDPRSGGGDGDHLGDATSDRTPRHDPNDDDAGRDSD